MNDLEKNLPPKLIKLLKDRGEWENYVEQIKASNWFLNTKAFYEYLRSNPQDAINTFNWDHEKWSALHDDWRELYYYYQYTNQLTTNL